MRTVAAAERVVKDMGKMRKNAPTKQNQHSSRGFLVSILLCEAQNMYLVDTLGAEPQQDLDANASSGPYIWKNSVRSHFQNRIVYLSAMVRG
jgi:hypothetical protein